MLAIEVELLGGRYAATDHSDRSRAEWPPHPARFFSALVAALHDRDPADSKERSVLEWLEKQRAPSLSVDLDVSESTSRRDVPGVFVPVNDVTIVGDPARKLREAEGDLAEAETMPPGKERDKAVADAKKRLARAQDALTTELAKHTKGDDKPSASALKTAGMLLPAGRNRQSRTFPVVVPERTTFAFVWEQSLDPSFREALDSLCARVTRLGHSSSLVRCRVVDAVEKPNLQPDDEGEIVLRTIVEGQLERLEHAHASHLATQPRILPAIPTRYGRPKGARPQLRESCFDSRNWIILERVGGDRPLASRASDLTRAVRAALIQAHGTATLPPSLSGHEANGLPASGAHLAIVALPFVGSPYADGSVQGFALVLPRDTSQQERSSLHQLVGEWERQSGDPARDYCLTLGLPAPALPRIEVQIQRVELPSKTTLQPWRWSRPGRRFITATPIALDKHPGNLRSNLNQTAAKAADEARQTIGDACERIGLPRPVSVEVSLAPMISGAQHVREFTPWPTRGQHPRRAKVHAEITFEEPVRGPVLIGAGRYFGLGLCLPVND